MGSDRACGLIGIRSLVLLACLGLTFERFGLARLVGSEEHCRFFRHNSGRHSMGSAAVPPAQDSGEPAHFAILNLGLIHRLELREPRCSLHAPNSLNDLVWQASRGRGNNVGFSGTTREGTRWGPPRYLPHRTPESQHTLRS